MWKGIVYVVSVALFLTVKAGSVGVYAPAILPGVTLASDVWQKYDPAPFGSNTTARIQAFYDMMCERVDVMDPDYVYTDPYSGLPVDKTIVSFPECPSVSERVAAAEASSVFPTVSQYRTLYGAMCSWLRRNPAVTPYGTENDGSYLHPYWQSPLCHAVGISVTPGGIVSRNTDVYPCSLSRFGYAAAPRSDVSNALLSVATSIGISYTALTNGVTAAALDESFCRFVDPITGVASYVDELVPGTVSSTHPLRWGPLYAFDRICGDLSRHNVAIIRLSAGNYPVTTTLRSYRLTYTYDEIRLKEKLLAARGKSSPHNIVNISPTGVSVVPYDPVTSTTTSPWAMVSAQATTVRAPSGYFTYDSNEHGLVPKFETSLYVQFVVNVANAELDITGAEPVCGPVALLERPLYLDQTEVTVVGRVRKAHAVGSSVFSQQQSCYGATSTSTSPRIGDAIRSATASAFTVSDDEINQVVYSLTNSIPGGVSIYVDEWEFSGSIYGEEGTSARILKTYETPYAICENRYNFTSWSGHVSQPTAPSSFIGPQSGYGDGDGGSDDFDVWVDAASAAGGDGSSTTPFRDIDTAVAAVNPNGGTHAVTNRTPKIGIRYGTYEWPSYFRRSQGGDTPYPVRLIGIGTGVTLDKQHKGSSGDDIPLARRSSLENLHLYVHYDSSNARSICSFILIGCRITGTHRDAGYDFLENSYAYRTLFDGVSAYCSDYQTLAYGCTFDSCLFSDVNLTSGWRPGFESCVIENSLVLDGKWGYLLKGTGSEILQSTCYLPDITDKTVPTATNCLFFVDGMVTTEDFRHHNVVTNAALFSTAIDTATKSPTSEYAEWRKMGFQGGTRTE